MTARRPKQLLGAALATAILAAGCGGADDSASGAGEAQAGAGEGAVGQVRAGSVAQLAQCHDWAAGTRSQRIATIHDIRATLNQAGDLEPTSDLGDRRAYALLQRACSNDFASGFRLYKLYARGAAFSNLGFAPAGGNRGRGAKKND